MKKLRALLAAACLMGSLSLVNSTVTFAQPAQGQQPAAAAQTQKADPATERKAYDTLTAITAETNCTKKLTMAKEALGLYATTSYASYIKDQVNNARGCLLQEALKADKVEDAIKVGDEVLAEDPDNLNYILTLADAIGRQGKKAVYTFADKGTQYATKAIALIDAGKSPAGLPEAEWSKRKPLVLASMHQNLALFLIKAEKSDEALTELKKSAELDCSDPITHYLTAQVHNKKYEALGKEYGALTDDEKIADKGKEILAKIDTVVDLILDAYGKMMASSEGKQGFDPLRTRVKPAIEELYKYRHDGKPDGMQQFLDGFKTFCAPKA